MSIKSHSFFQVLLESIDESFSILGSEPSAAVYHYLSTIYSLPKNEIPERIQDFDTALKKALGAASKVVERMILRKLFEKLGLALRESTELDFVDYINDAKRRFEIFSSKHGNALDQFEIGRSKKGQVPG